MPEHQAYRLTKDFENAEVITMAGPNGETLRLDKLLTEDEPNNPAGVLVTTDEFLKSALDDHVAFTRTVADDWQPAEGDSGQPLEPRELADLSKQDLVARAEGAGVDSSGTKAAILHRLAPDHFADPSGATPGPTDLEPDGTPVVTDESEEG